MIPTSVTNSPPTAGLAQNGISAGAAVVGGVGGAAATVAALTAAAAASAAQQQSNYSSIVLGLASLILEGRPIADDEYQQQQQQQQSVLQQQTQHAMIGSGRLSPRPSTSRAAINITTNPYASMSSTPPAFGHHCNSYSYGHANSSSISSSSSSSSNANSATHQRWTQKLCQLRQVSPAAQSISVEPELVALAINDLNGEHRGSDFEILRRVMLNRAAAGGGGGGATASTILASGEQSSTSAASSPGSDNILHSLQSLATTCLRGGPVVPAETRPLSLSLAFGSPPTPTSTTTTAASLLDYNCSRIMPGSGAGAGGLGVYGVMGTAAATSTATATSNATTATATSSSTITTTTTRPKHGPHCDQFLRKMGLAKGSDSNDAEEHICDMSYVNITCSRWRAHCLKMEAILARREPVCIEVYLGPAGHKILLEQWIISGKEKVPPPTMTLPSLCSAIRSQLYFSQIVAWCDLIRKCDASVYDSGRVIFGSNSVTSNAGDLAGQSLNNSGGSTGGAASGRPRPRLNIFYRIRPHDVSNNSGGGQHDVGGFNAKANVHHFPNVNIAENFSVSVCVKSLPRFNGGLPHIATPSLTPKPTPTPTMEAGTTNKKQRTPAASTPTGGGGMCAATPTGLGARIATTTTTTTTTTMPPASSCDKYTTKQQQQQLQRQQLQQLQEKESIELEPDLDRDELDGHRERQLQKYRKRMQRRDKKRERKPSAGQVDQDLEPMDEEGSEEVASMVMSLTTQPMRRIAMISTGTQTSLSSCQQCGSEKTLLCLNCSVEECTDEVEREQLEDADDTSISDMEDTSSCSLSSADLIVGTPRTKAEMLLQAIQRTPKNRRAAELGVGKSADRDADRGAGGGAERAAEVGRGSGSGRGGVAKDLKANQNNNHHQPQQKPAAPSSGCQVCKRQKTQHNFRSGNGETSMDQEEQQLPQLAASSSSSSPSSRDKVEGSLQVERCQTPPALTLNNCSPLVESMGVVEFKTPISHVPLKQQDYVLPAIACSSSAGSSSSPKVPHQLRLNCSSGSLALLDRETPPPMLSPMQRKMLPKINLSSIFCSPSSSSSNSAPVASDHSLAFCFEPVSLNQCLQLQTPPEGSSTTAPGNLHVQKSYSAPTLPNALAVSPRFAKQAAFYKRRSRHLSDRSDRSSLGSDEQLSDEDLESGMCSPAGSPLKTRARLVSHFTGRPLLGNLEESLLQKRLLPKIEVAGFRLQLGASGGFCPTQLTIPACSYFYELHGETLSTPYLCEIRLPRKGYSVPRQGTVQATLLNPMGTVVRMFVIPYDMRDMPPLHRTFIRQRILAEELPGTASPCGTIGLPQRQREPGSPSMSTTSKLGHFITAEQMKRLRYSIHLRFQTSRSGRLSLHTDIRLLISRRTDCDTAAAHAKGLLLEAPNELVTDTLMPTEPRYSARQESPGKI